MGNIFDDMFRILDSAMGVPVPMPTFDVTIKDKIANCPTPFSGTFAPAPATDIKEFEDKFVMEIEIPGYTKEEVSLEIKEDVLVMTAKHETVENDETTEEEEVKVIRKERRTATIKRMFSLENMNVDTTKISAKTSNGVLYITIPKKEEVKPETTKINID